MFDRKEKFNLELNTIFREFRRGSLPYALLHIQKLRGGDGEESRAEGAILDAVSGCIRWELKEWDEAVELWKRAFLADEASHVAMLIASLGQGVKYSGEQNFRLLDYVLQGTAHPKEPEDNIWIAYGYYRLMDVLATCGKYEEAETMYREAMKIIPRLSDKTVLELVQELEIDLILRHAVGILAKTGRQSEASQEIEDKVIVHFMESGKELQLAECYRQLSAILQGEKRTFEALRAEEECWCTYYHLRGYTREWVESCIRLCEISAKLNTNKDKYLIQLFRRHGAPDPESDLRIVKIEMEERQAARQGM